MLRSARSGARRMRRWRVLLAHDAQAPTCDAIVAVLADLLDDVDVHDVSSIDAALAMLASGPVDLCLVCLDLPPAPFAGVRLAQEGVRSGQPVVLVTRSLRWLPSNAVALRGIPWVSPEAMPDDVRRAIAEAMSEHAPQTDEDPSGAIVGRGRG